MANANISSNSSNSSNSSAKNSKIEKSTTTYDEMLLKKQCAPKLGLEENGPWDVVSVSEGNSLIMIHHKPEADMDIFGTLRGVVFDTKTETIVSYSYPHAPKFVASSLSVVDGKLLLDAKTALDMEKVKIKFGFEGPLIQVFKHGGKVYHATRKRLEAGKSRWGSSKTFDEIFKELQGPADNVLFDESKNYSPYCHTFIMNHPDVLVCTKDNVGRGNLIYLGPRQMYSTDPERCPYPLEEVDVNLHVPETVSSYNTNSDEKKIYSPELLTLEEANKHLLFGFYEGFEGYQFLDPRLLPGEFIILEDTETKTMYRIESPSYNWRSNMRNNNPNFRHRFFELLDYAYLKNNTADEEKYKNMFPLLTFYDSESLTRTVAQGPIIVWPQNTEVDVAIPSTRDSKLYNIWQSFLVSVPLSKQVEVCEYYNFLVKRRVDVINWLIDLSEKMNSLDLSNFSRRVQDILTKTRSFAADKIRRGENVDLKTREVKTLSALTKDNIRNFIGKEIGSSLYRIIREMDRLQAEAV
jgi:hypothetical protein